MQEILLIDTWNKNDDLSSLENKLKEGYKVINSVQLRNYAVIYILELINKPVETTNEEPNDENGCQDDGLYS